jgi:hypothetical protein
MQTEVHSIIAIFKERQLGGFKNVEFFNSQQAWRLCNALLGISLLRLDRVFCILCQSYFTAEHISKQWDPLRSNILFSEAHGS